MATETRERGSSGTVNRLRGEAGGLFEALAQRATSSMRDKIEGTTGRLTDYAEGDGGPGLMAAVTGARNVAEGKGPMRSMFSAGFAGVKEKVAGIFGGGKGKGGQGKRKLKLTNIVESVDVGVPIRLAYNQWTQYADFPTITKKVESVDTPEDGKTNWKAQVFWSHRTWEATVVEQHPDERIIWRSKGQKGHVDGAVTFHELGPSLTRIILVMEYHPQGMFERTGNLWRAQGRRARLELKHFQRHVMAHAVLDADDIEGWRGTIEDGEVVKDHETALQEEGREPGEGEEQEQGPEDIADEDLTDEERDDRERAGEEDEEDADYERDEESEDEEFTDEEPAAEAAGDEDVPDEDRTGNGRSAPRRRSAAGGAGNGRRPAAARSGRAEERPQRARRGATRGGSR